MFIDVIACNVDYFTERHFSRQITPRGQFFHLKYTSPIYISPNIEFLFIETKIQKKILILFNQ